MGITRIATVNFETSMNKEANRAKMVDFMNLCFTDQNLKV